MLKPIYVFGCWQFDSATEVEAKAKLDFPRRGFSIHTREHP